MKVLCKILGLDNVPASDGSIIPRRVMEEYLASDAYKKSIEEKSMISSLTHRCRNLSAVFPNKPALQKTVGKDDSLLIVDENAPTPTHVVTRLFINDKDNWLYGEMEILDENLFDPIAKANIQRLKGLLHSGILLSSSAVVVAYWEKRRDGTELGSRIAAIKGVDLTVNPSWKDSHIVEILDDNDEEFKNEVKTFSDIEKFIDFEGPVGVVKAKCFSNLDGFGITAPKTSKINNQFTVLKAKSFSSINPIIVDNDIITDVTTMEQKEFTQAQVIDRLRTAKLSVRMRMRRLILDYRMALKSQGGVNKIEPETLRIMKSLFSTDLLGILQEITPQVLSGKNLNALLGASSLGKEVRVACQNLQIPYRLALMESKRQGFVSKQRYQKISDAYSEFTKAILDYVFNTPTGQKLAEEEVEDEKN